MIDEPELMEVVAEGRTWSVRMTEKDGWLNYRCEVVDGPAFMGLSRGEEELCRRKVVWVAWNGSRWARGRDYHTAVREVPGLLEALGDG